MTRTIKIIDVAFHAMHHGVRVDEIEGRWLHDRIENGLKASMIVELNFEDVTVLSTHFLDAAFGRLLKDHDREFIRERLIFSAIEPDDLELVNRIIDNAVHFYKYPRRHQHPGKMVRDSERLAVGARVLAGYMDGRRLFGTTRESADADYLLGRKLGAARTDRTLEELRLPGLVRVIMPAVCSPGSMTDRAGRPERP